jgi:hypothetical protein
MSGAHARLSASSAHRWLKCPGSINLASGAADVPTVYKAEGTLAHEVAAGCLLLAPGPHVWVGKTQKVDGFDITVTQEMADAVNVYLDEIEADRQPGDRTWVEMPLLHALKKVDKDLGGTADFVRYRPSTASLRVYDFKYGAGTYVEADSNEQMMLYALGAMLAMDEPVSDVEVTIVQPRYEGARPIRSWKFSAFEILDFMADIKAAADASRQGGLLDAGDHCKWCRAAASCPELERKHHALVAAEFSAVTTPAAIGAALASLPVLKERIKAIEEMAYAEATKGVDIPGFKLVDKRPMRKWKSEGDVIEWAQSQALDPFAPREVLSPAQMEKVGGKAAKEAIAQFVESKSSGTVLVPAADSRPPAKLVTAEDFTEFAAVEGTASKK